MGFYGHSWRSKDAARREKAAVDRAVAAKSKTAPVTDPAEKAKRDARIMAETKSMIADEHSATAKSTGAASDHEAASASHGVAAEHARNVGDAESATRHEALAAEHEALSRGPKGGQFHITATGRKVYK